MSTPTTQAVQQTQLSAPQINKDITGPILQKIQAFRESGELTLPSDYSAENALKSAWLVLQEVTDRSGKPALEVCTKESIANSLLKMVVWGLSPLKKQGDFIVYGNKLSFDPEYTGNIALAKRYGGLKWIKANAIFEQDTFKWQIDPETGRRRILEHTQSLETFGSGKLKGAYAVYELNDGTRDVEIMNLQQIQSAWGQGATKGNSPAHQKFPDQMAIKTVINRACKLLIRSSDDAVLFDQNDGDERDTVTAAVKHEVATKGNKEEINFADIPAAEVISTKVNDRSAPEKKRTVREEQPVESDANEDVSEQELEEAGF